MTHGGNMDSLLRTMCPDHIAHNVRAVASMTPGGYQNALAEIRRLLGLMYPPVGVWGTAEYLRAENSARLLAAAREPERWTRAGDTFRFDGFGVVVSFDVSGSAGVCPEASAPWLYVEARVRAELAAAFARLTAAFARLTAASPTA